MKIQCVLFFVVCLSALIACGDKDEAPKVTSQSAVWSASVNGNPLAGDKVVIQKMNETDYSVGALQKTGNYFVTFFLPATPAVKVYDLSNSSGEIFYTNGLESSQTGELIITKYNADSLVANFSFTSGKYNVSSGIIKARLR